MNVYLLGAFSFCFAAVVLRCDCSNMSEENIYRDISLYIKRKLTGIIRHMKSLLKSRINIPIQAKNNLPSLSIALKIHLLDIQYFVATSDPKNMAPLV